MQTQSPVSEFYWPDVAEKTCYDSFTNLSKRVNQELVILRNSMQCYNQRVEIIREWQTNAMRSLMELKSYFTDKMDASFAQCFEYIRSRGNVPDEIQQILVKRYKKGEILLIELSSCLKSIPLYSSDINYQNSMNLSLSVDAFFEQNVVIPPLPNPNEPTVLPGADELLSIIAAYTRNDIFSPLLKNPPNSPCRSPVTRDAIQLKLKLNYTSSFGSFGTEDGQFAEPAGICVTNDGHIAVTDTKNHRVQVFDSIGCLKLVFGNDLANSGGCLMYPNCIAYCNYTNRFVITERTPTHQVQIYTANGIFVRKFGKELLQFPRGVTVDNEGIIIVLECKVMRISLFDQEGNLLRRFSNPVELEFPMGVCVNDKQQIFVVDNRRHYVAVFNYTGKFLRKICQGGAISFPIALAINSSGEILVTDNHQSFNMSFFTQDGELTRVYESRNRHMHCLAAGICGDNRVILATKDYRIYTYDCK